jgi:hypothetical protein
MNQRIFESQRRPVAQAFTPTRPGFLQRTCACGGTPGLDGECAECRRKRLALQRRASQQAEPSPVPPIVHEVLRSPGKPIDPIARAFMEPRFGHDFGRVRVHTGAKAAESARAVNAAAYTVGRDVVFGAGRYVPGTSGGQRLIAHELAHTIQQGTHAQPQQHTLEATSPSDAAEQEAASASEAVMQGHLAIATSGKAVRLARQAPETAPATPEDGAQTAATSKPACPVQATGTLSEVSWGETAGLYPTKDNKYQPEKWDAAKTCELLKARGAVHAVGQRGESVHTGTPKASEPLEQKLKIYHFVENFPSLDSEIADVGVKWFYLSPQPDKPEVHPATTGTERVKSYGSFYNVGGGDVKRGDTYIHFYRLKPKTSKTEESKPQTETPAPAIPNRDNPSDVIHE